ncbi:MAG: DUF3256 family protein [Parabacteroides sp.]
MKQGCLAIALWLLSMTVGAQDMASVFTSMPDQQVPQLEDAWRKDLVDLFQQGKEARVQNTMNGYTTLKQLTKDYLFLQVTERSTVEMKMLPLVNNTHVVCVVTTVFGPVPDSRVAFFTTEWEPLTASDLLAPVSVDDFLQQPSDTTSDVYQDALACLDLFLVHYTLSPEAQTLTATYTTPDYLNREDRKRVAPYIKPDPIVRKWEKFHFQ